MIRAQTASLDRVLDVARASSPWSWARCPCHLSDGTVEYDGLDYVKRMGHHKGRVSPAYFNHLAQFIDECGYMNLDNTYGRVVSSNRPIMYTTVVKRGQKKVVEDFAQSGPATLWAIEELIDKMLSKTLWEPKK